MEKKVEQKNIRNWKHRNRKQITGTQKQIQNKNNQNQLEMRYKEIIGNIRTSGSESGRNRACPDTFLGLIPKQRTSFHDG